MSPPIKYQAGVVYVDQRMNRWLCMKIDEIGWAHCINLFSYLGFPPAEIVLFSPEDNKNSTGKIILKRIANDQSPYFKME